MNGTIENYQFESWLNVVN